MVEDKRSKKVALVAHCLLNQNAKVNGFAFFPAMIIEIIELLKKHNYGILQLPCPETIYAGLHRWWYVRDQYDNPGFIRSVKKNSRTSYRSNKDLSKGGFQSYSYRFRWKSIMWYQMVRQS